MSEKIGLIYNDPIPGNLHRLGEAVAVLGVLDAVSSVTKAVEKMGYEVLVVPLRLPMSTAEATLMELKADIVFNLFEGFDGIPGSEAAMAQILEKMGVSFTGSSSRTLFLCQNKALEKQVLRLAGIPTPNWQLLSPEDQSHFNLNFPCIVKPLGEHASHGISADSVVDNTVALGERIKFIWQSYGCSSLVEEFVSGREFSALVMGNGHLKLFPIEEIVYFLPPDKPQILTYAAKWVPDDEYFTGTKTKCPAEISPELHQTIEKLALSSFAALDCRGYARVDMRQDKDGEPLVLEVNPNPDISSAGGARLQAEAAGLDYVSFISEILSLAQERACGRV